ncbi:MAG: hypothetical protein ACRDZ3_16085 [Acidimicrobiia bacterium]
MEFTFNLALAVTAFIAVFATMRSRRTMMVTMEEMRNNQKELLGEIQMILARINGDVDRLNRLIPEHEAPEAREIASALVRSLDEIILITRADWRSS